jgi:hypothetical protein
MTPRSAARLILAYVALVEGCAALIRFRERSLAFKPRPSGPTRSAGG